MRKKVWRKMLAAALCGAFFCAVMPGAAFADDGEVRYEYYDEMGAQHETPQEAVIVGEETVNWDGDVGDAWYVVNEDVELGERSQARSICFCAMVRY